ncbi:MAG: DNA repair protein RecN [bacterium]|nr:DNA repair protein RecN [bacterium]
MLARLSIRDFLLVKEITLDLLPGFTAITGETGAGKSMILGALRVLFGDSLSESMIRETADRVIIEAEFQLASPEAVRALLGEDADDEPTTILAVRRELTRGGRARGYIQDRPATVELLKSVGEQLMDLHGQRDSLSLFRAARQLEFLDAFAGNAELCDRVAADFRRRADLHRHRDELLRVVTERRKEQALLAYQLEEIERLGLHAGEDVDITARLKRLEQSEKLITLATQMAGILEQDDVCAVALTGQARQLADEIKRYDDQFQPIASELAELAARLRDVSAEVSRYAEHVEVDTAELELLRQRAATISELRRKHGLDLQQILERAQNMKSELAELARLEQQLALLDRDLDSAAKALHESAHLLTAARKSAAPKFGKAVAQALEPLGFARPRFEIKLDAADPADPAHISRSGADSVDFLFAASAGQKLAPLTDVASGGESSRVTLAIKSVVAERMHYPLLVYDEIDLGISGRVAAAVANLLDSLGRAQQLMVVTHLPQIAARANHHLEVSKSTSGKQTLTSARLLKPDERAAAVAALLAGTEISGSALAAAGELLNSHKSPTELAD